MAYGFALIPRLILLKAADGKQYRLVCVGKVRIIGCALVLQEALC